MTNEQEELAPYQQIETPSCTDTSCCPPRGETYKRAEAKVGRNDPCPCGNGKKFKKCCGRNS